MNPTAAMIPPALLPMVRYLDGLKGRAPLPELQARLELSRIALADVSAFAQFDPVRYRRNVVAEGNWYSLLVLCWRSGQRSPIHDHAASTCAFKVLAGICSETVYDFSPCGQVVPWGTRDYAAGEIVATQDTDTHQVSNLQPPGRDLVTLHLYSPPLHAMHRFSILGAGSDDWRASGADLDLRDGKAI